jgi:hypothetical protein
MKYILQTNDTKSMFVCDVTISMRSGVYNQISYERYSLDEI